MTLYEYLKVLKSDYARKTLLDAVKGKSYGDKEIEKLGFVLEHCEMSLNGEIHGIYSGLWRTRYPDLIEKHYDKVWESLYPGSYQDHLREKQKEKISREKKRTKTSGRIGVKIDEEKYVNPEGYEERMSRRIWEDAGGVIEVEE